jgi:hypothetical protein
MIDAIAVAAALFAILFSFFAAIGLSLVFVLWVAQKLICGGD